MIEGYGPLRLKGKEKEEKILVCILVGRFRCKILGTVQVHMENLPPGEWAQLMQASAHARHGT